MINSNTIKRAIELLKDSDYLIGTEYIFYHPGTKRKFNLEKMVTLGGYIVAPTTMAIPNVQVEERRAIEQRNREIARRERDLQLKALALRVNAASKTKVVGKLLGTSPLTEYEQAWMDYHRVLWG